MGVNRNMKSPDPDQGFWEIGSLIVAWRLFFSVKQKPRCDLDLTTYSLTTFATNPAAGLASIGDLLKISQGC